MQILLSDERHVVSGRTGRREKRYNEDRAKSDFIKKEANERTQVLVTLIIFL
jgi:hypothetical protein